MKTAVEDTREYRMTSIGELPSDWNIVTLGECHSGHKSNINPQDYPDEIFEYYSIPAFQEGEHPVVVEGRKILSQKIIVENNTVLFGKLNPRVEKVWRVQSSSESRKIGSTEWLPIAPVKGVDSSFIYFLEYSSFVMPVAQALVSGSTPSRQRVDPSAFYKIVVPSPPLPEQKKIAAVLSAIQEAKEKTENVISALKEMKRSMMKHLFTYGAVPIDDVGTVKLKETEIGVMPEHWMVARFGDVVDIAQGQVDPRITPYRDMLHIGPENIQSGTGRILAPQTAKSLNLISGKYYFASGSILYSKIRPYLKKAAIAPFEGICSADMYPLTSKPQSLLDEFLYHYLLTDRFTEQAISYQNRTGIPKINRLQLNAIPIPLPTYTEQLSIAETLSTIDAKIQIEDIKINSLNALFNTLLSLLMTGKLRVNHLEI